VLRIGLFNAAIVFSCGPAFSHGLAVAEPESSVVLITTDTPIHDLSGSFTEAVFRSLHARWRAETDSPRTDMRTKITHPAYLRIIGMGMKVVPFVLAELKRSPDHWGTALEAITGAKPVPQDARGNMRAIAKAWLEWGRANLLVA